jgi:F1F0 ATPase subunit 2
MNETLYQVFALIAGVILGILFFGGLWFTVNKLANAKTPALWMLGSLVLRVGITMTGFYFVSAGNLQILLTCVLGFFIARYMVVYFTKLRDEKLIKSKNEKSYEA